VWHDYSPLDGLRNHPGDRDGNFAANRDGNGNRLVLNDLLRNLLVLSDLLRPHSLSRDLNLNLHIDRPLDLLVLHNPACSILSLVVGHWNLVGELLVAPLLAILNLLNKLSYGRSAGCVLSIPGNRRGALTLLCHRNLNSNGHGPQHGTHADSTLNSLNRNGDWLNNVPVYGLAEDLSLRLQSRFRCHDCLGPLHIFHTRYGLRHGDSSRTVLVLNFLLDDRSFFVRGPGNHDLFPDHLSCLDSDIGYGHFAFTLC